MHVLDAAEIMQLIPNRYPILYMDYVDELTPGESIVATKNVTINENFGRTVRRLLRDVPRLRA